MGFNSFYQALLYHTMGSRRFHFGDLVKQKLYQGLHAPLFDATAFKSHFEEDWLDPLFVEAVKEGKFDVGKSGSGFLTEHIPGLVYSFPCFSPELCDKLLEEIENIQKLEKMDHRDPRSLQGHVDRPNGMNRYGVVLNQLGLEPFASFFQTKYVHPLARTLFPVEAEGFDDHHCFCVRYSADEDTGLDMHEDDSDVTLNVCLGKKFEGATLSFCGTVDDSEGFDHRRFAYTYAHKPGRAVIHLGRHRHGADNIASGERVNFLLWSLNAKYRVSEQFQRDRMRREENNPPSKICLSYTHDADYAVHTGGSVPSNAEAEKRGVMLHQVERRKREEKSRLDSNPVRNLVAPGPEINQEPCLCVFVENAQNEEKKRVATELVRFAEEANAELAQKNGENAIGVNFQAYRLLCYCAVARGGAVPQIRELCRIENFLGTSPPPLAHAQRDGHGRHELRGEQQQHGHTSKWKKY